VSTNSLGLLVEFIPSLTPTPLEQLIVQDKMLVAKFLAMCFFDRGEWPELCESGGSLYTIDLERIGPIMLADELTGMSMDEVSDRLSCREAEYARTSDGMLREVLSEADQLGVREQLASELRLVSNISSQRLQQELLIGNHPHASLLSTFFFSAVHRRQRLLSGRKGL
jgi:hypothetical protein